VQPASRRNSRLKWAEFLGAADRLDNGEVLIANGGASEPDGTIYHRRAS
jgi:hypothetical protein